MNARWIIWLVMTGCGPSADERVADLSASDQQSVCEDFVDTICGKPSFVNHCTPCAKAEGCAMAVTANAIATQCGIAPDSGHVTVGMVENCASSGSIQVCYTEGGGCMFTALQSVCP